jgi:hypothetical protein
MGRFEKFKNSAKDKWEKFGLLKSLGGLVKG